MPLGTFACVYPHGQMPLNGCAKANFQLQSHSRPLRPPGAAHPHPTTLGPISPMKPGEFFVTENLARPLQARLYSTATTALMEQQ